MRFFRIVARFLVLLMAFEVGFQVHPANAALTYSFISSYDSYTPTVLNSAYDVQYLQILKTDIDPATITFVAYYAKPITADIYRNFSGKSPFGAVLIYRTNPGSTFGGDKRDIAFFTSSVTSYSGNREIVISGEGNTFSGGSKSSLSACSPRSWTDLNSSANWIAFKVNKSCANIPDQFWIQYYSDENENAGTNRTAYDWIANSAIYVDLTSKSMMNPSFTSPFTTNGNLFTPIPTPSPTIKKLSQTIQGFDDTLFPISERTIDLTMYSDQGQPIIWESTNEDVCWVNRFSYELNLEGIGSCSLVATAQGNSVYDETVVRFYLSIWEDYSPSPTPKATKKPTKKATPTPTPKKSITGSASVKKKVTPSAKASVNGRIGGSATGKG